MKILVRTISSDPKFPLEIESWETLDELKQKIFQTIGVPPDQQSCIFAGRKLGDGLIADQIHRIQSTPHRDELLNRFTENSIESSTTGSGSPLFNILLVICMRGGGNVVFHRPDQSDCDSDDDDDVVVHNALMSCSNETTMSEEIEMEESTSNTPPMKRRFFSDIADSMLRRGYTRSQLAKLPRLVQDRLFSRARKGNGEPIGCLNNNSPNVVEWELGELGNNQSFMRIIQNSGLDNLRHCSYRYVDRTIINAFAERWHPKTNTFQLPFGEMTITLDDVSSILKIPVTGKAVSHLNNIPGIGAKQLLIYLLGVSIDEAEEELNFVGGDSVRLQWLKGKFSEVPNIDDPRSSSSIVYAARAYILYLLGCTLFANKNMTVSVMYLHMLRDVNAIHTFSWGSACLSVLYKQLGTPRSSEAQGYLTLVEAWIYEHIPFLRPHLNLAYTEDLPRVLRWICKPKGTDRSNGKLLRKVRRSLDLLRPNQVVWDPYQEHREQHPFQEVAFYTGYIKCFDAISAYHPERVLRQFGLVQTIPSNPLPPISKRAFQMAFLDQFWERWESHVLSLSARGERASQPWDVATSSYLHWYGREVRMSGEDLDKLKASLYNADPNRGSPVSHVSNGADTNGPEQDTSETRVKGLPDTLKPSQENGIRKYSYASNASHETMFFSNALQMFFSNAGISMNVALLMIAGAVFLVPKAMREIPQISRMLQSKVEKHDAIQRILKTVSDAVVEHGRSFALSATLLVVATALLFLAIRCCKRSPTMQSSKQEKQNLYLEVLRDGERVKVSVSNIIVGDIVLSELKGKL